MNVTPSASASVVAPAEQLVVKEESSVMKDSVTKEVSVSPVSSWLDRLSCCSCVTVSTTTDQIDPVPPKEDIVPEAVVSSDCEPADEKMTFYNLKKPFARLVMKKPAALPNPA